MSELRVTYAAGGAVLVELDGITRRVTDPELQAHVRYIVEHQDALAKKLRVMRYHDLILIRSPAGNGAQVLDKSLPFTPTRRARE